MKNYLFFFSMLILAACSSGGGSSVTGEMTRPRDPTHNIVSDETYNSNQHVTSMASRLLVARNGSGHSLARSASTVFAGTEYDEYDLSDVSFNLADEGFGGMLSFGVNDDKKIVNFSIIDDDTEFIIYDNKVWTASTNGEVYLDEGTLKTHNGGVEAPVYNEQTGLYTYTSNNPGMSGSFKIINDTVCEQYDGDEFTYDTNGKLISNDSKLKIIDNKVYSFDTFERTSDEDFTFSGQVTTENNEQTDATLTYYSVGKDVKLRYSDFGYFKLESNNDVDRPVSIIGGYDIKKIEHQDLPNSEIEFHGKASGSVVALRNNDAKVIELLDSDSTLVFNGETRTATLDADFTNWYDVQYKETYAENGTATDKNIKYYNYADDPNANVEANYFRMLSDTYENNTYLSDKLDENEKPIGLSMNQATYTEHDEENNRIQSDLRYYGDNGTPTEMVGLIQVRDCDSGNCGDNDEIRMNLGFGGKHDTPTQNPRRN